MSLEILTENHGEIECGFKATNIATYNIGEYTFLTRSLLDSIAFLASTPSRKSIVMLQLSARYARLLETELARAYAKQVIELISMQKQNSSSTSNGTVQQIEHPRHLNVDSVFVDRGQPRQVSLLSNDDIMIGRYRISEEDSQYLFAHAICGGMLGWPSAEWPQSAINAKNCVKSSTRPYFQRLSKQI